MGLTKPRAAQIYNLDYKQATRVVTTTNITLSGGAPSSVDGVSLSLNDRVLVTGQTTGSQNGIYKVTTVGSGANGTWARTSDANDTGEIEAGMIIMVTEGTVYADTQWKLITNDPITIGTTALTFTQNYSANSITGGTSNVTVYSNANVTISSAGTANVLTVSSTGTVVTGTESVTGNITGGNISTGGQISATGTITTAAGTNSTGFAVGNGAVSNVGLGFFPTAGTRGDYAIRDYSTVFTTMYLDAGMGGSGGGEFQFRSSNAFSLLMRANSAGVYSTGVMSATGSVYGLELSSTNSVANEGGQINLALPSSGSTLSGSVIVDVYQNKLRFFEGSGNNRGAYIDLSQAGNAVSTNLLAGGGGGTPGGSNTYVQFNDGGLFGGNGQFVYNKVTNTLTAGIVSANNNGNGTNFQVGDDAWIGDINVADTMSIRGQQSALNGYIIFGNADANGKLGRAGTGPITCGTGFSATGNITGGNIITGGAIVITGASTAASYSATGNVTGGNILTAGIMSSTGNATHGNLSVGTGTITGGNIVNSNGNGVGNIGSSTTYFNTVFAKATSAQYADLAEMYCADSDYGPGTVIDFGGAAEVTASSRSHSTAVAGIVSTNPSYLMNSTINCEHAVAVALTGRVPCRVVGTIRKGDRLVSSGIPGVATVLNPAEYEPGCIIGKALENYDSRQVGTIEVAVGRY